MCPSHSRHSSELLPGLLDELFLEILLRIPPDRPECLVRASLVSKAWRRALSGPAFCRRYRDFHRTPPLLGFFYKGPRRTDGCFVSTTAFRPLSAPGLTWLGFNARHGRALFRDYSRHDFVVWDPLTGDQRRVPSPSPPNNSLANCALLCAMAAGCDHSGCHSGPFLLLAFLYKKSPAVMTACVYSSEHGAWSQMAAVEHQEAFHVSLPFWSNVLVGSTVYIPLETTIMGYNMDDRQLTVLDVPCCRSWYPHNKSTLLMKTEEGTLGFASLQESKLRLWSRRAGRRGVMAWAQDRVIDLETVLPIRGLSTNPRVAAFAEDTAAILISTGVGFFTIELGSGRFQKVSSRSWGGEGFIIPYTSFYTLGTEGTGLLCATPGCDHRDCHGGPFLVAFVYKENPSIFVHSEVMCARVYSSESGTWSDTTSIEHPEVDRSTSGRLAGILVENTVYVRWDTIITGYNLDDRQLKVIDMPSAHGHHRFPDSTTTLMTAEDGTLGFAALQESNLHLWSRRAGREGAMAWAQYGVIDLEMMLPISCLRWLSTNKSVVGFADGVAVIFIETRVGVFSINLSSYRVQKVSSWSDMRFVAPYMSFYNPDLSTRRLPPPCWDIC